MMAKRFAHRLPAAIDAGRPGPTIRLAAGDKGGRVTTDPPWREISVVLVAKIAALALLYCAFFSPSHRPHLTPAAMAQKLSGDVPPPR
jgi:hypothetical protein